MKLFTKKADLPPEIAARVPKGQYLTEKWPVLHYGPVPSFDPKKWDLRVFGAVGSELRWSWDEVQQLDAEAKALITADMHCVTTWSRLDLRWRGVRLSTVLALAEPTDDATHLMAHGSDSYTTNLALEEALKDDVLLAHTVDDGGSAAGRGGAFAPLPREHGGPLRMITPQLYAWKGSKWICRLELLTADRPGFWEERGYSMTAHPWRNDRYRND